MSFSTAAIQLLMWAIYYSIYLRLSRLQFRLLLCAVIKFRAQLKAAQLCRGQVILGLRHQASHGLVSLSRPHHSFEGITLVATQIFCRDINFFRDRTFDRDLNLVLLLVLTK